METREFVQEMITRDLGAKGQNVDKVAGMWYN